MRTVDYQVLQVDFKTLNNDVMEIREIELGPGNCIFSKVDNVSRMVFQVPKLTRM